MKQIPECFLTTPIVYAVGKNYQIMVPVSKETLMWAEVDGKCYYDDVNGILRSNCTTHRMTVPMKALDKAKEYKVCYRIVNERKPYFSDVSDVFEYTASLLRSNLYLYPFLLSSSFLVISILVSPRLKDASIPLCIASLIKSQAQNMVIIPIISPAPCITLPSIIPIGGTKKPATISRVAMIANAIVDTFVVFTFFFFYTKNGIKLDVFS